MKKPTANHPALADFRTIVGKRHTITDPAKTVPYRKGIRYGEGDVLAVVQPQTLYQLWQIAETCVAHDLIIIMQASNTGLTGGSSPYGDYDRPVVLVSTRRLKGIRLIENGEQAIALPGATLYELEDALAAIGREPHSVIGSSCIGASIIGGICNNSGGALIHRGPAYTEMAAYARLNENGELELVNHLGLDLGSHPEALLNRLQNGDYTDADIQPASGQTSDHEYQTRVRDIDADTPARYNNDGRRLFEASGSAGRLIVFAVRIDTFAKPARQQTYYIGTHDPDTLTELRRHILGTFKNLPVSGEYMHRDCYDIAERYGRDTYLVIDRLGSKHIPRFFRWKNTFDRWAAKLHLPTASSDRLIQCITDALPSHLPAFMRDMHQKYEHHLILKMADGGVDEAAAYLDEYFSAHPERGAYYACNGAEGAQATLHRFAAAGAANRYHAVHGKQVGDLLALDIALRRNERDWFERLPPEIDQYIAHKLYYGHFFCHVMHQDYILKPGTDAAAVKHLLLDYLDGKGAEYPAEHNVGHLYHAKEALADFYRAQDPTNSLNPGIGKTTKKKHWAADGCGCGGH